MNVRLGSIGCSDHAGLAHGTVNSVNGIAAFADFRIPNVDLLPTFDRLEVLVLERVEPQAVASGVAIDLDLS